MQNRIRTAILISGGGSNMEALVKASLADDYPAEISIVISNVPSAGGLEKAKNLGIETQIVDHKNYKSRKSFEKAIQKELLARDIELVCNAGFMRILTPWFVEKWRGRQLNIHPSLLPKYKGLHTHQRALDAGDDVHGCTVHFVNEGMDEGEIIDQMSVPILENDSADTLAARVLKSEHKLYPMVLKKIASQMQIARR